MKNGEFERVLTETSVKFRSALGRATIDDDGLDIRVLIPRKTYELPLDLVEQWKTRPRVVTRYYRSPRDPGPILAPARLELSRGGHNEYGEPYLSQNMELQVLQQNEGSGLWWVYKTVIYRDHKQLKAVTLHFKDEVLEQYRSPVWGKVMGDQPKIDQLQAFNVFLGYALTAHPVKHSSDSRRYTI